MNNGIKDYFKKNILTWLLLIGMIALYFCIPSQIVENMIAQSAISPRFFPTFSVVAVIIACALILIFDAVERIRSKGKPVAAAAASDEPKEELSYLRVVLVAALLLVWYFLMPVIGFIISTVIVMCVMSFLLGCRNRIVLIVFPVVFTLALYYSFVELLHVSLPEVLF